jgi:hypothetical protein
MPSLPEQGSDMPTHTNHHSRITTYTMPERHDHYAPEAMHCTTKDEQQPQHPSMPRWTRKRYQMGQQPRETRTRAPEMRHPIPGGRGATPRFPTAGSQAVMSEWARHSALSSQASVRWHPALGRQAPHGPGEWALAAADRRRRPPPPPAAPPHPRSAGGIGGSHRPTFARCPSHGPGARPPAPQHPFQLSPPPYNSLKKFFACDRSRH